MSTEADVLDLAVLRELREILGPQLDAVLATFRVQAGELAAALEAHLAAGNLASVRSTAHQLKSAAGSVGAARLAALAAQVERGVEQGDGVAAAHAAAQVPSVAAATQAAITQAAMASVGLPP
ncbi:MAG: Hpt domain-containing protein [Gemmatimonas sp.]|jgi:HPt (histidine-containing phosphotransfer) domain-containing protein